MINHSTLLHWTITQCMVQHFLRGESGIYYEDLYPLITFLPRHNVHPSSVPTAHDVLPMWIHHDKLSQSARSSPTSSPASTLTSKRPHKHRNDSFDPEKALPRVNSEVPLQGARIPPQPTVYDYFPLLITFKPIIAIPKWIYRRMFKKRKEYSLDEIAIEERNMSAIETNIPLEITMFLHSYFQFLLKKGYMAPAPASGLMTNLCALQDTVTNLDRVRSTPIPFAYQVNFISYSLVRFSVDLTANHCRLTCVSPCGESYKRICLLIFQFWVLIIDESCAGYILLSSQYVPLPTVSFELRLIERTQFQIVQAMGWYTIPYASSKCLLAFVIHSSINSSACFASFLLLGFLEIGQEM